MTNERKLELLNLLNDRLIRNHEMNKLFFLCNMTRDLCYEEIISYNDKDFLLDLIKANRPEVTVGACCYWISDDLQSRKEFIQMLIKQVEESK